MDILEEEKAVESESLKDEVESTEIESEEVKSEEVEEDDTDGELELDMGAESQISDDLEESKKVDGAKVEKMKIRLRKRAQKSEKEVEDLTKQNDELRSEIKGLADRFDNFARGDRPKPFDYDTEEAFYEAHAKWESPSVKVEKKAESVSSKPRFSDELFSSHYGRASELKVSDYEETEQLVRDKFDEVYGENSQMADGIISLAGEKSELVIYAFGKDPKRMDAFIDAMANDSKNGTDTAKKLIWAAEQEVKLKPKKRSITKNPEEIPKGKSNADAAQGQIDKAFAKWRDKPTAANHKALSQLRANRNG